MRPADLREAGKRSLAGATRYICPFCKDCVAIGDLLTPLSTVEDTLRDHVISQHPVRWRISPRYRRAIRHGQPRPVIYAPLYRLNWWWRNLRWRRRHAA